MADIADAANDHIEAELARSIAYRKPVPTTCECGEPCAVLTNGARARFCEDCLEEFRRETSGASEAARSFLQKSHRSFP